MFNECVRIGAIIGFKAFFAVLVFILCCGVVLSVLSLLASIVKLFQKEEDE